MKKDKEKQQETYKEKIKINENALDTEWKEQPFLFMQYSLLATQADKKRKELKNQMEIVKAEVDVRIRKESAKSNEKTTEKMIESSIITSSEYKEIQSELIQAEHEFSVLMVAVRSFEQRKSALENLVKLQLAGYFSEPVIARNNSSYNNGLWVYKEEEKNEKKSLRQQSVLNKKRRKNNV